MRKLLYIAAITVLGLNTSCDDGDIITTNLTLDDVTEFKTCGELIFYKVQEVPFESLSLSLSSPSQTIQDFIDGALEADNNTHVVNFELSNANNSILYRSYGEAHTDALENGLFCSDIPLNISITNESQNENGEGTITVTTTFIEDDNDGIPAAEEDLNNDGDYDNDDTDGDGIPNYLDDDDDGDNVPTIEENHNYTVGNGLSNAQNTDGVDQPDYLDPDDDNDGVLTRDEENETQDQDPTNDIASGQTIPDYLNVAIDFSVPATAYREHTIQQEFTIQTQISNFILAPLTQTLLDYGTLTPKPTAERTVTPDFN